MKDLMKTENPQIDFFDALLQIAREATNVQTAPSSLCINQSRNINNVRVNVYVSSPTKPGFFRRMLSKLF